MVALKTLQLMAVLQNSWPSTGNLSLLQRRLLRLRFHGLFAGSTGTDLRFNKTRLLKKKTTTKQNKNMNLLKNKA